LQAPKGKVSNAAKANVTQEFLRVMGHPSYRD